MGMTHPTDAELLNAHLANDPAAFAALRARYLALVYAASVRQTTDTARAEDVTQGARVSGRLKEPCFANGGCGAAGHSDPFVAFLDGWSNLVNGVGVYGRYFARTI